MENSRKLQILRMARSQFAKQIRTSKIEMGFKFSVCYCFDELSYGRKIKASECDYFINIIHEEMINKGRVWGYEGERNIEGYNPANFWAWNPYDCDIRKKWFRKQIKLAESV